ncbi:DNA-binding protein [Glycomyces endophyticus]|uniref:DNA-binding protein n=1 Tax=Glycomyces endophyticus TaxID=480996 RepID=A0ABN2H9Q1_9ACTN
MTIYEFELHFTAPPGEQVIDALYEAGWGDALVAFDPDTGGEGWGTFSREAPSALQAVVSAIREGRMAGVELLGVTEDYVTLTEIANRTDRTLSAVDHWATGRRGPGDFPAPRVPRPRVSLYSWAEVTMWLVQHGLAAMSPEGVEVARVCEVADATLRARRLQNRLPEADREALNLAVA